MPPLPGSPVAPPPAAPTISAQPSGAAPASDFAEKNKAEQAMPELETADMPPLPEKVTAKTPPTPNNMSKVANEAAKNAVQPGPVLNAEESEETAAAPPIELAPVVPEALPGLDLPVPPAGGSATALPAIPAMPGGLALPAPTSLPEVNVASQAPKKPPVITWNTKLAPTAVVKKTNFNYRRQILPDAIYRPAYSADNRHLPVVVTMEDYNQQLQLAAANNDLNATRALLKAGASTQGVLEIAQRHGAQDTAALLQARGGAY